MAAVGVIHGVPFVFNTFVGSQGWHLFLSPALVIASNETVFGQADLRLVAAIVFIHFLVVGGRAMLLRWLRAHAEESFGGIVRNGLLDEAAIPWDGHEINPTLRLESERALDEVILTNFTFKFQ